MKRIVLIVFCLAMLGLSQNVKAQAGMTVSPGKLYFKQAAGASATQKIVVSNPNSKDLEVGISMNDWEYDSLGNNQTYDAGTLKTSAADWIKVMPGSYFTLKPGEKQTLDVVFSVPAGANQEIPVHTAMMFLTQLNPGDGRAADGTSIKVSVRMGIKVYHSFSQSDIRDIEVVDFTDALPQKGDETSSGFLELKLNNTGKQWLEGKVKWEILNTQTGEKKKLPDQEIYSLPGDHRIIRQILPPKLAKGSYTATAIINYGDKDELKLVELEFQR